MRAALQMEFRCTAHASPEGACQVCRFLAGAERQFEQMKERRQQLLQQLTDRLVKHEVTITTLK